MINSDIAKVPSSFTAEANTKQAKSIAEMPSPGEANSSTTAVMVRTRSLTARLDALTSLVRDKLKPGLDEALQEELAELLKLIPELDSSYHERFIPIVEIAALSLLSDTPNITLAKRIREGVEQQVHRSPLLSIVRGGGSPPTRVILGLGTLLYIVIPLLVVYLPRVLTQEKILGIESSVLLLVATAGAVGSVVSIMVRIRDFEQLKNMDPSILFFTGLFKPIIGTAFALFVFATLSSGLIPVTIDAVKAPYFFTALAFVSGFSERFAEDIATRAEETIVAVQSSSL